MDEWDKIIRQKVSGLDTPPPGTGWQPARGWEKLQWQLKPAKPLRPARRWPWYYAAAAAFVILLVPFAVMLSDIRRQQARIDQLSAQVSGAKPETVPPPSSRPAGQVPTAPPSSLAQVPAAAIAAGERQRPLPPAMPVADTRHAARQQKELLAAEPEATRLAGQPVPDAPDPVDEAAKTAPPATAGESGTRLLQLVSTAPKRKATSVTIVFAGTDPDTTGGAALAASADPAPAAPRRRRLRAFGGAKREESLSTPSEAPHNILSLLNKQQQ